MKYRSMAKEFSFIIFTVLFLLLLLQVVITVKKAHDSTMRDYSSFCAKIAEEDSGKISYWNAVLLNDLRMYSQADITANGTDEQIVEWLVAHSSLKHQLFNIGEIHQLKLVVSKS